MASQKKRELRQLLRARRLALPWHVRQQAEKCIVKHIIESHYWQSAQRIACYFPFEGETNISALYQHAWQENKALYLPVLREEILAFSLYEPSSNLRLNQYQIAEVATRVSLTINLLALDLIILPLVGFDAAGHRLGMGKGYYDKTLAGLTSMQKRPVLMGVAFACQQVEPLPIDPWDITLDVTVTEEGIIKSPYI